MIPRAQSADATVSDGSTLTPQRSRHCSFRSVAALTSAWSRARSWCLPLVVLKSSPTIVGGGLAQHTQNGRVVPLSLLIRDHPALLAVVFVPPDRRPHRRPDRTARPLRGSPPSSGSRFSRRPCSWSGSAIVLPWGDGLGVLLPPGVVWWAAGAAAGLFLAARDSLVAAYRGSGRRRNVPLVARRRPARRCGGSPSPASGTVDLPGPSWSPWRSPRPGLFAYGRKRIPQVGRLGPRGDRRLFFVLILFLPSPTSDLPAGRADRHRPRRLLRDLDHPVPPGLLPRARQPGSRRRAMLVDTLSQYGVGSIYLLAGLFASRRRSATGRSGSSTASLDGLVFVDRLR